MQPLLSAHPGPIATPVGVVANGGFGFDSAIHRSDFPAARQWQEWARPYHQRSGGPFSVICGYCLAGIAAREQRDLDAAEASYRHALELATDADGVLS